MYKLSFNLHKHKPSVNGFTLVELIITFLILSILAVVAYSNIAPLSLIQTGLASNRIQTDIRYTQALAISIQRPARILFDSGADSYTVSYEGAPGSGIWTTAKKYLGQDNFTILLASGSYRGIDITEVDFDGAGNALVFDKWGNPCVNNYTTALSSSGRVRINSAIDITVRPVTGEVYIQNV